ncbi:acyl carrier protein [Roseateles sp. MS654]|uniref:acyl carrier protein n=1 Tax=Roseateles sp. MS654 TaxID=3412685 RepID=UPI003C2BC918
MNTTLEELRRLACHDLGMSDSDLKNDVTFAELGLDSLMLVDFMFSVEDKFHIEIDHDAAMKRPTMAGLAALVDEQLATQAGTGAPAAVAA